MRSISGVIIKKISILLMVLQFLFGLSCSLFSQTNPAAENNRDKFVSAANELSKDFQTALKSKDFKTIDELIAINERKRFFKEDFFLTEAADMVEPSLSSEVFEYLQKKNPVIFEMTLINPNNFFHHAISVNNFAAVKFLVEKGADINCQDSDAGVTAMKSSVDRFPDTEDTGLMWAAGQGLKEMVQYFLEKGANVHLKNVGKATALHFSASRGYKEISILLVQHGANPYEKDNSGISPVDYHGSEDLGKYIPK